MVMWDPHQFCGSVSVSSLWLTDKKASANATQILKSFYFSRFVESLETKEHQEQPLKMWLAEEKVCEAERGSEIKK